MTPSESLRNAIETAGVSRYRLAKQLGIHESVLSKFVNGKQGVSLRTFDKIAAALSLELQPRQQKKGTRA